MIRSFSPMTVVLLAVIAVLLASQGGAGQMWPGREPVAVPWVDAASTPRGLIVGATTLSLARNAFIPWKKSDLRQVDAFERRARAHAGIVMWFADWGHNRRFDIGQARAVAARGSIPEISWEPWDASAGTDQSRYTLASIIAGDHDRLLRRWGRGMAAFGGPIRLRFAHEMNGRWYPWSERANGNRRGEYVRAWRHVRRVVRAAGATNVLWVWCPVSGKVPRAMFPGPGQVDVLGVAGFNGGTRLFTRRWRTFRESFGRTLKGLHKLAPGLPVEVSEVGSTDEGGDKPAWIRDMFSDLAHHPYVEALIWFELRKESDWRIASSPASKRAFATGLANLRTYRSRKARAAAGPIPAAPRGRGTSRTRPLVSNRRV